MLCKWFGWCIQPADVLLIAWVGFCLICVVVIWARR